MVEKIGHIKNPLTVIAMFAGIAEISGTIILPFIAADNQGTYIWFLMLFPFFLVGTFFLTLNLNYRVLYAPSDYKDEKNFVNPYGKASIEEQNRKLRDEVKEIEAEDVAEKAVDTKGASQSVTIDTSTHELLIDDTDARNSTRYRQLMSDVILAEKLSINKLSRELGLNFKTDVSLKIPNFKRGAVYDALSIDANEVHAVEVKLFKAKFLDVSRFAKVLEQSEVASQYVKNFDGREFTLHIFVVMDSPEVVMQMLEKKLHDFTMRYNVKVKVHISTLNDLQNEYQYSS